VGLLGIGLIAAGVPAAIFLSRSWRQEVSNSYRGFLADEVFLEIRPGTPNREVAEMLEREGVIKSALLLRAYLKQQGDPILQAGRYQFTAASSMAEVVEKLRRGRVFARKVTIPEGLDLAQVAVLLVEAKLGSVDGFMRSFGNRQLISDLDPQARDLEGYLLPDTYFVSGGMSEEKITERMVREFRQVWESGLDKDARRLGMTPREVVTLASMIEKETGRAVERPLVSSVFHNRLRLGMKLACDPTVIYAVKLRKFYDGIINRSDLQLDSPYNTYLYPGLPPGPIANPGRASLEAAIHPAESDFLYFVSRNDGTHVFSTSYAAHSTAVKRFQR